MILRRPLGGVVVAGAHYVLEFAGAVECVGHGRADEGVGAVLPGVRVRPRYAVDEDELAVGGERASGDDELEGIADSGRAAIIGLHLIQRSRRASQDLARPHGSPSQRAAWRARRAGTTPVRLPFAEPLDTLALAVERLAAAWELHAQDLAASP